MERALELDPELADAFIARGNLKWTLKNGFPHDSAIRDFRRALELNPSYADGHRYLGRVYGHIGLFDRARAAWNQALRVDPKDLWVLYRLAGLHLAAGDYEKALAQFDAQQETTSIAEKALTLAYLGREDEAFALTKSGLEREPKNEDFLGVQAILLARRGAVWEPSAPSPVRSSRGAGEATSTTTSTGSAALTLRWETRRKRSGG